MTGTDGKVTAKAAPKTAAKRKTATTKKTEQTATVKKAATKKVPAKKATAKKAAVRKAPAKKASPAKAVTKKKAAPAKARPSKQAARHVTHEQRWRMVAEAAYLKAEKRHFTGGSEVKDWLVAEAEVDARLKAEGVIVKG